MTSLRSILTIAATYDLELHQANIEGAYLNSKIDVELYMGFPDGLSPSDPCVMSCASKSPSTA
jgi:hypothetical protein